LRIAKPMLAVTTPVGVVWGIVEAWRFHWWLAVLMALLVAVIGAFFWMTVARIRRERDLPAAPAGEPRDPVR
jgi:flagellar biosynthesis/type III secretory pathway M-ring protein FliF/YscJ